MYSKISFHCRMCGIRVKVLIRDNNQLRFRINKDNYNEKDSLTIEGYFLCCNCDKIDKTIKFEKVYN